MSKKRHYHCIATPTGRIIVCGRDRAGKNCLRKGYFGKKCEYLKINYK